MKCIMCTDARMLSTEDEFTDYHVTTEQLAWSSQDHGGGMMCLSLYVYKCSYWPLDQLLVNVEEFVNEAECFAGEC